MKKLTKILICLMLCVFSMAFVACDNRTDEEKSFTYPSISDAVVGNGGLAVQKGNYLYFVNGHQSVANQTSSNSTYNVGALMLTKLDENGNIVTDENGLLKDDYYITMSNKLCGYEATNLYIHGEYLYFATPSLETESKETSGSKDVWAKERVVISRIKLDKTSKVEIVYESGVKYDSLEYEYYEENGNLFILAYEKGDCYYEHNGSNALIRIDARAKTHSKIANGVNDVVFAKNANEIFYKVDTKLYRYNIASASASEYATVDSSLDIQFVADGELYATQAISVGSMKGTKLKASTISNASGFRDIYTYTDSLALSATPDGLCVVGAGSNKIVLIREGFSPITIDIDNAESIEVAGFANGCVIFVADNGSNSVVMSVSYSNAVGGDNQTPTTLATLTTLDVRMFDMSSDSNYFYLISKQGSNNYLTRVKIQQNLDASHEIVGVYESNDIPKIEETPEETPEDEE